MSQGSSARGVPVLLPRLAAIFVIAWMGRNVIVTATEVPAVQAQGPVQFPGATREPGGDLLQQAFIHLDGIIPRTDRVLVLAENPHGTPTMAQWWSSYWLYPRLVQTVTHPVPTATFDVIVTVNGTEPAPAGWTRILDMSSGETRVRAHRRRPL